MKHDRPSSGPTGFAEAGSPQRPGSLEPVGSAEAEIVVRRSRFLARAVGVVSAREAQTEIRRVRADHPDASHVVYAFLVGDLHSEHAGMSDAGEPKGTAGRPVMEIVRGSGIRDLVVTIARYYGGTKLGTGGLVRAYGDAARAVLERLRTTPRVHRCTAECRLPYDLHERVRGELRAAGAEIRDEEYSADVRLVFTVDAEALSKVERIVRDLSRGSVTVESVTPGSVRCASGTPGSCGRR